MRPSNYLFILALNLLSQAYQKTCWAEVKNLTAFSPQLQAEIEHQLWKGVSAIRYIELGSANNKIKTLFSPHHANALSNVFLDSTGTTALGFLSVSLDSSSNLAAEINYISIHKSVNTEVILKKMLHYLATQAIHHEVIQIEIPELDRVQTTVLLLKLGFQKAKKLKSTLVIKPETLRLSTQEKTSSPDPSLPLRPISEEDSCLVGGAEGFVVPNETENIKYSDILSSKRGTLISVGTFRGLFHASMGNFSRIILFDCNPKVVKFNQVNVQLIQQLGLTGWTPEKQRLVYLALITGKSFQFSQIDAFLESAEMTEQLKVLNFLDKLHFNPNLGIIWFLRNRSYFSDGLRSAIWNLIVNWHRSYNGIEASLRLINMTSFDMTYWRSNEKWLELTGKNIDVIQGNLSGPTAIKTLGRDLSMGNPDNFVSVLDISNSENYLSTIQMQLMMENLTYLPKMEDFRVLTTVMRQWTDTIYGSFIDWHYLSGTLDVWNEFIRFGIEQNTIFPEQYNYYKTPAGAFELSRN